MLEFKKIELCDKDKIEEFLKFSDKPSLEYNFTTLFIWQKQFNTEFAISDNMLFIRSGDDVKSYLFPCGSGDIDSALLKISDDKIRFHCLTEKQAEYIEKLFPKRFCFYENRDSEDYVYTKESLENLTGKKLSAKRNHINRFIAENPDWSYEKITLKNLEEVKMMHKNWCELTDKEDSVSLKQESCAVSVALENFEELGLLGGLIRTAGKVCAFSVGDELSKSTFLVHIEKAYNSYTGAYQLINREFVKNNCADYEFINREDDAGDEGLRKAKLSYRPHHLVKKIWAKEKDNDC